MAFELLRTDYVDATFEGLRRYLISENGDGSVSFHDVTNYTVKEKSFFGAKDANTINTAVNAILAALENGTDLYEVFTQFFELQKTLFLEESDAKQGDFAAYITQLREYMDKKWDELKTEYTGDIQYFKDVQENAFKVWFQMVRDQLTNDVAGHLQTQIGNLDLLDTEDKESLVNAVNELKDADDSQNTKIGNLENLKTNEKSSLVVAINNLYTMLQDAISKAVKKAGDIMTGNLTLLSEKLEERKLQLEVNGRKGWFCISNNKRLGIYDGNNNKWLVMAEPDGTTVLNGRAESATTATAAGKLSTARSINGLLFDGTGDRMNYAVCDGLVRDGDDYVINAACPGFKLAVGAEIRVLMKTARISGYNSRTKLLLNVNNTGRLEIKDKSYRDVDEGVIYTFMYDGSQWIIRGIDNELECYDKAFLSGADSAVSIYIPLKFNGSYLLVGRGYADTGKSMGTDDYFKASLLINKASGDDADWYNVWQEITLGTSGSTARFSTVKEKDVDGITFKVPKGSAASIYIYKLET